MSGVDPTAELIAAHQIRQLACKFALAHDSRDMDLFEQLFAPAEEALPFPRFNLVNVRVPYVILRPQYFMQMQLPALRAAAASGVLRGPAAPDLRLGMVDTADIAAVAAAALTRPDFDGQTLVPTGPSAPSFTDMAAALGALLGREIGYEQRPRGEVEAELAARGWPEWHIEDYFLIHGAAASDLTSGDVERVTGRPPTSFDAFLRSNADAFDVAVAP